MASGWSRGRVNDRGYSHNQVNDASRGNSHSWSRNSEYSDQRNHRGRFQAAPSSGFNRGGQRGQAPAYDRRQQGEFRDGGYRGAQQANRTFGESSRGTFRGVRGNSGGSSGYSPFGPTRIDCGRNRPNQSSNRGQRGAWRGASRGFRGTRTVRPPKTFTIRLIYTTSDCKKEKEEIETDILEQLEGCQAQLSTKFETELQETDEGNLWSLCLEFRDREFGQHALEKLRKMDGIRILEQNSSVVTRRPVQQSELDSRIDRMLKTIEELSKEHEVKIQNLELDTRSKEGQERELADDKLQEAKDQQIVFAKLTTDFHLRVDQLKEKSVAVYKTVVDGELKALESELAHEATLFSSQLPIYAHREKLIKAIADRQVTVVAGETGCGKSTQLVQFLLRHADRIWPCTETRSRKSRTIVCCEPRKVVAHSLWQRVAHEVGQPDTVGLSVGVATHKAYASTRIHFATHHSLLSKCLNSLKDATESELKDDQRDERLATYFQKYSCVIIDEAHERTVFADLLLAIIKRVLPLRKSLKLVVMSATINEDLFVSYFQPFRPSVCKIPGRLYPVRVEYHLVGSSLASKTQDDAGNVNGTNELVPQIEKIDEDNATSDKTQRAMKRETADDGDAFDDDSDDDEPIRLNEVNATGEPQAETLRELTGLQSDEADEGEVEVDTEEEKVVQKVVAKTLELHQGQQLDRDAGILVFLTSPLECDKAQIMFNDRANPQFKRNETGSSESPAELDGNVKPVNVDTRIEGPDFVSYVLHGHLKLDEQNRLFEKVPDGKRKVIFSTNVAETSVTIPEVGCVIDCGLSKQKQFDHARRTHVLKKEVISRSAADQRKGRAGRTRPGLCVRLYHQRVYDKMELMPKAEILVTHLGTALLQLLRLGMSQKDLHTFDFVEAPDKLAIDDAFNELARLGALDDNGLITEDGHLMAALNELEPLYAKLAILSSRCQPNCVWEGCTLAALLNNDQRLFERPTCTLRADFDRYRKERSWLENCKWPFANERGDTFMMLEVMRKWKLQKTDSAGWCNLHCLVEKHLRLAQRLATRVRGVLKRFRVPGLDEEPDLLNLDERYDALQKVLFSTFRHQVAMFGGCHVTGGERESPDYVRCDVNTPVKIHFTSVLDPAHPNQHIWPQWVVFDRVLEISDRQRVWMLTVTSVKEDWLVEEKQLNFDVQQFKKRVMQLVHSVVLGDKVRARLIGRKCSNLHALVDRLRQESNEPLINMRIRREKQQLDIWCSPTVRDSVVQLVNEAVEATLQQLAREQFDLVLENAAGPPVQLVLGDGLCVSQFLMPGEFRRCKLQNVPLAEDQQDEPASLRQLIQDRLIDQPVHIRRFSRRRPEDVDLEKELVINWGELTFNDMDSAKRAVDSRAQQSVLTLCAQPADTRIALHSGGESPLYLRWHNVTVQFNWLRSRSKGCGEIELERQKDVNQALKVLREEKLVGDRRVRFQFDVSKTSEKKIFFKMEPSYAFDSDEDLAVLQNAVHARLSTVHIFMRNFNLFRDTVAFADDLKSMEKHKEKLSEFVKSQCDSETFKISLQSLKSGKEHRAYGQLSCSDPFTCHKFLKRLKTAEEIKLNGFYPVRFQPCYSHLLTVENRLFRLIEKPLIESLQQLKREYANLLAVARVNVNWKEENEDETGKENRPKLIVNLHSTDSKCLSQVQATIIKFLEFEELGKELLSQPDAKDRIRDVSQTLRMLCVLEPPEKELLQKQAQEAGTLLVCDRSRLALKLFGLPANRLKVMPTLLDTLWSFVNCPREQLDAKDYSCVLKQLYESKFDRLTRSFKPFVSSIDGLKCFEYDYVHRCFHVVGTHSAIDQVRNQLTQFRNKATPRSDDDAVLCMICGESTTHGSLRRLNSCGHPYCSTCLAQYVLSKPGETVQCTETKCNRPLLPCDILALRNTEKDLLSTVVFSALNTFAANNKQITCCPIPNCPGLLRLDAQQPIRFVCLCRSELCTGCGKLYHPGLDCQLVDTQADNELQNWLAQDPNCRRLCPKCSTPLEKETGCDAVVCTCCHLRLCWRCPQAFFPNLEAYEKHCSDFHSDATQQ